MTGNDEGERGYVIKVGAWIRSIRRQQQLSLQDVEAASDDEFKASVLGAYERGERRSYVLSRINAGVLAHQ